MKFSKKVVILCIAFIIIYTILQLWLSYKMSEELSPTLTGCVYAFFGTELAALAFIKIFNKENPLIEEQSSDLEDVVEDI